MQTIRIAQLQLKPGQKVLDLGCGEGRHAHAVCLLSGAEAYAVDIALQDVQNVRKKLHGYASEEQLSRCLPLAGCGMALPFANNTFDAVICSEVLEHVPHYEKLIAEMQRVTKPGAQLAVSVPRAWPERICWQLCRAYHEVEGGHIRIFNARALRTQIEARAFLFQRRHWAHALHAPYWWLRCLFWHKGERFAPVRWYHRLLVWDLMHTPRITQWSEQLLNPLLGKSVVMYFIKKED